MLLVPAPPVIIPLLMVQTYVAPPPALGTEAVLPIELAQTEVGEAVIVEEGKGLMTTEVEPVTMQLPDVTCTERFTVPEAPAV